MKSDYGTRFAVVVKDIYYNEQGCKRHRPSTYVASVISNTCGSELSERGRIYHFGGTIGEVDFIEVEDKTKALEVAERFNKLADKGIKLQLRSQS